MADSKAWRIAASAAAGLAIASVLAVIALSGSYQQWGSGTQGFFLGAGGAEKLANPYNLRVAEAGNRFAVISANVSDAELLLRSSDPIFTGALASANRLVAARWSDGLTAVFLANFTYKEALTLSREAAIAAELSKKEPIGLTAISEEQLMGKGWLVLVRENWFFVIIGAAILYISYLVFYALFGHRRSEE